MYRITLLFVMLAFGAVSSAIAQPSTQSPGQQNMSTPEFRVAQVDMAIDNLEPTVRFYEKVFNVKFNAFEAMGHTMYSGQLLGFNFVLTPNALAGVEAKQSRIQFEIVVNDMDAVLKRVTENGGTIREEQKQNGNRYATVVDPDKNTIVFHGKE